MEDKKLGDYLKVVEKKERGSDLFCRCLHEIENELERTKFCMRPCRSQYIILSEREKVEDRENLQ